jgi:hypothetical protein
MAEDDLGRTYAAGARVPVQPWALMFLRRIA